MFIAKLCALGIVGALIGYLTNTIAVKMLFRPLEPIKIPILGFHLQGLIPKRRQEIAQKIGEIVERELISIEEIVDKFLESEGKEELVEKMKVKILTAIESNLPPFAMMFGSKIIEYAEDILDKEMENMVAEAMASITENASLHIKLEEVIEEKINAFELDKIEEITLEIAKKELKHIELLGGVIGFFIGIMQGLIVLNI